MDDRVKVLVISDTHGNIEGALEALKKEPGISEIWHLGDHASDAKMISDRTGIPFIAVRGNCDGNSGIYEESVTVSVMGRKAFLAHGHTLGVGFSLLRLQLKAEEEGAEIALFGHTHVPDMSFQGRLIMMNPGSISLPRMGHPATYGILKIGTDGIYPEIKRLR